MKGIISRIESKDYYIFSIAEKREFRCSIKGKLKNKFKLKKNKLFHTDIAVVGDIVEFELNSDGTGVITDIEQRTNYLSRKAPRIRGATFRGERLEQIIAANIDQVFIITSIEQPSFNNKTVDRFLITCQSAYINCNIIINKVDLDTNNNAVFWTSFYNSIGYNTIPTSVISNLNVDLIARMIKGKKSLFWGPSGVGKSSLLNKIFPQLNLKVAKISSSTLKGKHTTVTSRLFFVGENTFVIDTPGIREIEPYGIKKENLGHFFSEFKNFINHCRFNTCTHNHEPGCAIVNAVKNSQISPIRYDSYLRILYTIEDDLNF